jgi:hypothetical protein
MYEANVKIIADLKAFITIVTGDRTLQRKFCLSDTDFTRDRKLPFGQLVVLIARLCKKSLSVELEKFFEEGGLCHQQADSAAGEAGEGPVADVGRGTDNQPLGGRRAFGRHIQGPVFHAVGSGDGHLAAEEHPADGVLQRPDRTCGDAGLLCHRDDGQPPCHTDKGCPADGG